jgi:hypothetical protein
MKKIENIIKNKEYKKNQKETCSLLEKDGFIGKPTIIGYKDGYFSMCLHSKNYIIYFDVCPGYYEDFVDFNPEESWKLYDDVDYPLDENEEHKFDWVLKKIELK